jgi:hypothetical protein
MYLYSDLKGYWDDYQECHVGVIYRIDDLGKCIYNKNEFKTLCVTLTLTRRLIEYEVASVVLTHVYLSGKGFSNEHLTGKVRYYLRHKLNVGKLVR